MPGKSDNEGPLYSLFLKVTIGLLYLGAWAHFVGLTPSSGTDQALTIILGGFFVILKVSF